MPEATTAQEVTDHFCVSEGAQQELDRWQRERPEVAEHVLRHVTRVPYRTDMADLRGVMQHTEHALGEVKKVDVENIAQVGDWNPRFAMMHVLHYALESIGEPFTYQAFRSFCRDDAHARWMLWEPAQAIIKEVSAITTEQTARDAMRWRIGLSYYSFLRELVVVEGLRERGLNLEVHPLADALFKVDAWIESTVLVLYIGNAAYRDGKAGRKPLTEQLLGPSFHCVPIKMPTQSKFGQLHVPTDVAFDVAASKIRESLGG